MDAATNPAELVRQIEATGEARRLLRLGRGSEGRGLNGICAAFVDRILDHFAGDPSRARALARHWRAFHDHGDDPALAYRAKGIADKLDARPLASARAFLRAGELARDPVDRYAFAVGAVDGLARAGRVDEALELGTRLAAGLDGLRRPALAARARLNAANALLWAERNAEARALYGRAIPVFAREGMTVEEAAARLGLSTTHLYGGDPTVALREAEAALELARAAELDHLATLCEINLAQAALVRGRADEAFGRLLALRPRLEDHPAERARAQIFVGEACLRLNLFTEASAAFAAALAEEAALPRTDRADALIGLGEAERDPQAADRHLVRAAARFHALGNRPWQSAALAARVARRPGARTALGLARRALDAAEGAPYHQTIALLAYAAALAARGRDPHEPLRRAARIARRYGFRRFAWQIHALRARTAAAPLPHYRRMLAEILRERLAVTSVAARTGFLEDKADALGAYLAHLLAAPTPRRVAEAREAIRRTRAATLLDEIVSSGVLRLDSARVARIEALRAQVVLDAAQEPLADSRRALAPHPERRAWTEATHALGALDAATPPAIAEGCVVLAEAGGRLWALVDDRAIRLGMDARELEEGLEWLWFELGVPTAFRDAPPREAIALLAELRAALVEPWRGGEPGAGRSVRICPDGPLWRVPWNAIVDAPTTLLLHPSLAGGGRVERLDRVAIWIDRPPDLPNAPLEERALCARFPGASVLRTRREVMDSLGEVWDLVHVVGHARHNAENPMFSALSFPDGPIYAAEIARSGLRTRLASLSACETGALSHAVRAEPDGLVRAFLAGGAGAVLASLWPLDDESAARFFGALYTRLRPGDDLGQAVEAARRGVREWREHPYFWASLALFGGYRP